MQRVGVARYVGRVTASYVRLYIWVRLGEFEWDERKAQANLRKHRVDFADAATIFEDERAVTVVEDDPEEERYVT